MNSFKDFNKNKYTELCYFPTEGGGGVGLSTGVSESLFYGT